MVHSSIISTQIEWWIQHHLRFVNRYHENMFKEDDCQVFEIENHSYHIRLELKKVEVLPITV